MYFEHLMKDDDEQKEIEIRPFELELENNLRENMNDSEILQEAYDAVYNRPDKNGEAEDSFEDIANFWSDYIHAKYGEVVPLDKVDVAMMMNLLKVGRHCNDLYDEDNFVDMAGYAENAARLSSD